MNENKELFEDELDSIAGGAKQDTIETEGVVKEAYPNSTFLVEIGGGREVKAHISARMRMNYIRVKVGDRVTVELSPYDLSRGKITYINK